MREVTSKVQLCRLMLGYDPHAPRESSLSDVILFAHGLHYVTVASYYCFLLFFVHWPEGYSGTFLQKVHFLKIAISFTSLIPCRISPTDDRENSDSTPRDKKVLFVNICHRHWLSCARGYPRE